MYDSIVVPIDGSDCADRATEEAIHLADRFDADVSFLAVLEPYTFSLGDPVPEIPNREDLCEPWRLSLDRAETLSTNAGVPCTTTVEVGTPKEEIEARAEAVDADLIVLGTHGRTGLQRLLLGSTTESVLRSIDIPILTVPEIDEITDIDGILVPTDGSPGTERAVAQACALAQKYDASVHGLSVVNTQVLSAVSDAGGAIPEIIDSLKQQRERDVDTIQQRADELSLNHTTTVAEGEPKQVIREYVNNQDVDVISMGTHGRDGIDRFLLGSVTEHTIREVDVPVLTTPIED